MALTLQVDFTASNNPRIISGRFLPCQLISRHSSSSTPYSTPAGQTGSQARHPRQKEDSESASLNGIFPSCNARIKVIRPRGEDCSSPVN